MSEIENAKIESTTLTSNEGHGIPSCMLHLDYGDSRHQGFGGYDLRHYGIDMIVRILDTVGVEHWEDLTGKYIRAEIKDGLIIAIGHITEDQWYYPKETGK